MSNFVVKLNMEQARRDADGKLRIPSEVSPMSDDLIVKAWAALNQSPISLRLPPAVRGLDMQSFLEKVVEAALLRCGTSKEVVELSMGGGRSSVPAEIRRQQARAMSDPGHVEELTRSIERDLEEAQQRRDAANAQSTVDSFMKLCGR